MVSFLPKKNHHFSLLRPTERERTERLIKTRLREIMMQKDLENITSKEVRDLESSLFKARGRLIMEVGLEMVSN